MAVSVDPRGDTPANVARFLKEHQLTGRDAVPDRLRRPSYDAGVAEVGGGLRTGTPGNPEFINPPRSYTGSGARAGKLTTVYPANLNPARNRPRRPAAGWRAERWA